MHEGLSSALGNQMRPFVDGRGPYGETCGLEFHMGSFAVGE